jgi:hypothetical protein
VPYLKGGSDRAHAAVAQLSRPRWPLRARCRRRGRRLDRHARSAYGRRRCRVPDEGAWPDQPDAFQECRARRSPLARLHGPHPSPAMHDKHAVAGGQGGSQAERASHAPEECCQPDRPSERTKASARSPGMHVRRQDAVAQSQNGGPMPGTHASDDSRLAGSIQPVAQSCHACGPWPAQASSVAHARSGPRSCFCPNTRPIS